MDCLLKMVMLVIVGMLVVKLAIFAACGFVAIESFRKAANVEWPVVSVANEDAPASAESPVNVAKRGFHFEIKFGD